MDKINKALLKLTNKQRHKLIEAYEQILAGQLTGLNIKKMKCHSNLYRLRVGDARLVYREIPNDKPIIVYVGRRDDQTYRDF